MNVTFTTSTGQTETHKALRYAFPKKGNAAEGFHFLNTDGEKLQAVTTGGGKYPKYTYFIHNGHSYYLPKNVNPESGTTLTFTEPAVAQLVADTVANPPTQEQMAEAVEAPTEKKAPRSRNMK